MNNQRPHADTAPRWKQFSGNVLVAEDNPANRMLIQTLLSKHGLKVVMTEDGQQAVDAALADRFDLILMDMQMPVMNGYEATRCLRDKGQSLPIIALTASVMVGDKQKCLDIGCDDFLGKPIDRRELTRVFEKYLSTTDGVESRLDQLNNQARTLNRLVDEATPNVPQSILTEDKDDN